MDIHLTLCTRTKLDIQFTFAQCFTYNLHFRTVFHIHFTCSTHALPLRTVFHTRSSPSNSVPHTLYSFQQCSTHALPLPTVFHTRSTPSNSVPHTLYPFQQCSTHALPLPTVFHTRSTPSNSVPHTLYPFQQCSTHALPLPTVFHTPSTPSNSVPHYLPHSVWHTLDTFVQCSTYTSHFPTHTLLLRTVFEIHTTFHSVGHTVNFPYSVRRTLFFYTLFVTLFAFIQCLTYSFRYLSFFILAYSSFLHSVAEQFSYTVFFFSSTRVKKIYCLIFCLRWLITRVLNSPKFSRLLFFPFLFFLNPTSTVEGNMKISKGFSVWLRTLFVVLYTCFVFNANILHALRIKHDYLS